MELKSDVLIKDWSTQTEVVVETETQRILRDALRRLGPNGENWYKGRYCTATEDKFCTIGAIAFARHGRASGTIKVGGSSRTIHGETEEWLVSIGNPIGRAAQQLANTGTIAFNDAHATTFSGIRALFEKAITLAGEQAA